VKIYWLEQNQADVPPGDGWLGGRELEALSQLRIPKRRADWRLGRWTAKIALAARHQMPRHHEALAGIEIVAAASGAPEVMDRRLRSAISLSHSGAVAACALADAGTDLGCDVEAVAPRSPAFLEDYFTPLEQLLAERSSGEVRCGLVTLMWSAKESTLKALRCGLRADTRSVCTVAIGNWNLSAAEWQPLVTRHESGRGFSGWWRQAGSFIHTVVAGGAGTGETEFPISRLEEMR
jgi:4'-phosphopantetheinyl transferase